MSLGSIPASAQATKLSGASLEDFLKIMVTQLQYQDPMQPMDNQQFVAQMAQFAALEQTQELNTNAESTLSVQTSNQAISLLGRTVDVLTSSGTSTGHVKAVNTSAATPQVTVNLLDANGNEASSGATYPLSQISAVR